MSVSSLCVSSVSVDTCCVCTLCLLVVCVHERCMCVCVCVCVCVCDVIKMAVWRPHGRGGQRFTLFRMESAHLLNLLNLDNVPNA